MLFGAHRTDGEEDHEKPEHNPCNKHFLHPRLVLEVQEAHEEKLHEGEVKEEAVDGLGDLVRRHRQAAGQTQEEHLARRERCISLSRARLKQRREVPRRTGREGMDVTGSCMGIP